MVCCLLCFSDEPHEDDMRGNRPEMFQIRMIDAPCKEPLHCCTTYFCTPCSTYYVRQTVLGGTLENYSCCQGYMDNQCFKAGKCGETSCPQLCLCLESFLCLGPSMSSSRMFMMDKYDLASDPCDRQMIRFVNCLMIFACICDILGTFMPELRDFSEMLRTIANCVFYSAMGCMAGQVHHEVNYRKLKDLESPPAMGGAVYSNQPNAAYQPPVVKAEAIN